MPARGEGSQTKVFYKAKSNDFVVIVDSVDAVEKWRKDSSTPLVDVVDSYDIFVTHKHGAQGVLDRASHSQIENEFGSTKAEDAIEKILREGQVQQTKGPEKFGSTNDAKMGPVGHN